jgi:hypothetical protein
MNIYLNVRCKGKKKWQKIVWKTKFVCKRVHWLRQTFIFENFYYLCAVK